MHSVLQAGGEYDVQAADDGAVCRVLRRHTSFKPRPTRNSHISSIIQLSSSFQAVLHRPSMHHCGPTPATLPHRVPAAQLRATYVIDDVISDVVVDRCFFCLRVQAALLRVFVVRQTI